ncbi:relaxase/mobilization nuclease domain-containing protein [Azospirillum agricola]|uniref:relaxase/mobilization nuclease domain-containing protein n=1 Tax=Azospirillum agricola TaxID=1720247 RepID=UPI000A0F39D5|nr:relaxase [Azospirillum agricola]SMH62830.1 hypothetical protein SAMN02982994_6653 [Azospirillum lipoferum]
MILKASQRGGGGELARHLLRLDQNEHVEVHELRGFVADDLRGAFREAYALSKGTRCRQFLFSLSLNPPQTANVPEKAFRDAIRTVEKELGLTGQPRVIVFHEKEGRRHAHCVWSRIKANTMTAVNLPHFKMKLRDISRALYVKHDWRMPDGLVDQRDRSPLNFTREQWQQAKRAGLDPKTIKSLFQQSWAASDSLVSFSRALEEKGFWLAQGDRRGFVAVDFRGEVYSVARTVGTPTKTVNARLGDSAKLPSVEQVKATIAQKMTEAIREDIRTAERAFAEQSGGLALQRREMVSQQRAERQKLKEQHEQRRVRDTKERAARLSTGLWGLWQKFTGRYGKIRKENEQQAQQARLRDQAEKESLIAKQLADRRTLQRDIREAKSAYDQNMKELYRNVAQLTQTQGQQQKPVQEQSRTTAEKEKPPIQLSSDRAIENTRSEGRGRRREPK